MKKQLKKGRPVCELQQGGSPSNRKPITVSENTSKLENMTDLSTGQQQARQGAPMGSSTAAAATIQLCNFESALKIAAELFAHKQQQQLQQFCSAQQQQQQQPPASPSQLAASRLLFPAYLLNRQSPAGVSPTTPPLSQLSAGQQQQQQLLHQQQTDQVRLAHQIAALSGSQSAQTTAIHAQLLLQSQVSFAPTSSHLFISKPSH